MSRPGIPLWTLDAFTDRAFQGNPAAVCPLPKWLPDAVLQQIAAETLPKGVRFEWTDLTYQQILAGNSAVWIFPICVLLVFLVLAAQYESLTLPLAVILIVPMSLFAAMLVWLALFTISGNGAGLPHDRRERREVVDQSVGRLHARSLRAGSSRSRARPRGF